MYSIEYRSKNGFIEYDKISRYKYEKYSDYKDYILLYHNFEELFDIIKTNIYEFWVHLYKASEYNRLNSFSQFNDLMSPLLYSNQKIANILTSVKSYEDNLKRQVSNYFGNSSKEYNGVKDTFSRTFDNSFEYRFFYNLRNYIQHYGLPFVISNFSSKLDPNTNSIIHNSFNPMMKKDELLRYKKWGKAKEGLEKLDNEIDVKDLMNNYFSSLLFNYKDIKSILNPNYTKYRSTFLEIYKECVSRVDETQEKYNRLALIVFIIKKLKYKKQEKYILPIDLIRRVDKLILVHNLNENNLSRTYTYLKSLK